MQKLNEETIKVISKTLQVVDELNNLYTFLEALLEAQGFDVDELYLNNVKRDSVPVLAYLRNCEYTKDSTKDVVKDLEEILNKKGE